MNTPPTTLTVRQPRFLLALVALALVAAVPATAQTVVFDQGPTTGTESSCYMNQTSGQNFADKATLAAATQITAISIYTCRSLLSGTVHVKILADSGGVPGSVLYSENKTPDSWVADAASGGYKVRVALTGVFNAQAGVTYWYGVSGNPDMGDLEQEAVLSPGDSQMAQFLGTDFIMFTYTFVGDQMFELEGAPEPIPTLDHRGLLAFALLLAVAGFAAIRRFA